MAVTIREWLWGRAGQALAFGGLLFVLYFVLCLPYYTDPVLFGKDCGLNFEFYYGADRSIKSIYLKTQGYFSFTLYFFPWLFAYFPTWLQPYLYTYGATIFIIMPVAFVFWGTLFRAPAARTFAGLILAFWHYWANGNDEPGTIFIAQMMSFWPVCLLYYLLILQMIDDRKRPGRVLLLGGAAVPALLSHPYTIAALPALLFLGLARAPRLTRTVAFGLIALSALYAATHDDTKSDFLGLLRPNTMLDYVQYLVNHVVLMNYGAFPRWAAAAFLVVVVAHTAGIFASRQDALRRVDPRDVFILVFIAGLSAIYFASYRYEQYGTNVPLRYSFVQQGLWLVFLLRRAESLFTACWVRRWEPLAWMGLTVIVLALRGAGTDSCFLHLHSHEAAVRRELFAAMSRLEAVAERRPEVAWIIFVPNHNWPTRYFLVGDADAREVVDVRQQSRDRVLNRLRELGASEAELSAIARGLAIYGVDRNLAANYRFEIWEGGAPAGWEIGSAGETRVVAERYDELELPALSLRCEAPGSSITLSQAISVPPYPPGARLRFSAHTRLDDGGQYRVRFAIRAEDTWQPIAEHVGSKGDYWLRQEFDAKLPDHLPEGKVWVSLTTTPVGEKNTLQITNVVVAVIAP